MATGERRVLFLTSCFQCVRAWSCLARLRYQIKSLTTESRISTLWMPQIWPSVTAESTFPGWKSSWALCSQISLLSFIGLSEASCQASETGNSTLFVFLHHFRGRNTNATCLFRRPRRRHRSRQAGGVRQMVQQGASARRLEGVRSQQGVAVL